MPDLLMHVLTALIGALGGLLLYPAIRRKTDAEGKKTEAEAWAILVENLSKRVARLEEESGNDKQRIADLEDEVATLRRWIEKQGLTPPPRKNRNQ